MIEDIVNDAITSNENRQSVKVVTDQLNYSSKIKQTIETEFSEVLRLFSLILEATIFLEDGMLTEEYFFIKRLLTQKILKN